MNERTQKLVEQIEVHGTRADGKVAVTLPKPEWKGWTLSQEMAAFDAQRERNAIHDAEHGFDVDALGYPINPNL